MTTSSTWKIPGPVLFLWVLGAGMVIGDAVSGNFGNPMSVCFYSFLPAALWMMVNDQSADKKTIAVFQSRVARLEEALRATRADMDPVTADT